MKRSMKWVLCVLVVVSVFAVPLLTASSVSADSLSEAIS